MHLRKPAWLMGTLALLTLLGTAQWTGAMPPTWQVQSDYRGTRDVVSQPRSLRGLALSPDGSSIYGGFIQGTSSAAIRKVSTAILPGTITVGSPQIEAVVTTFNQPKGVAVDDRGYVYATLNPFGASGSLQFRVYTSDLSTLVGTSVSVWPGSQLAGIAVRKLGNDYYVYLSRNGGAATIERWLVTNPAAPALDTTWAVGGRVDLKVLSGNVNAYCNGLEVDADGTIYCAGGLLSTTRGDTLFKIAANGSAVAGVPVNGAMDVALFQSRVYVTQYLSVNSAIQVREKADLSFVETLATGIVHPYNLDNDNGYAGIDISADGRIYVADQIYNIQAPNRTNYDRILVSSPLEDTEAPVITCPPDVLTGTDEGDCVATVDPGMATAVDGVDGPVPVNGVRSDGEPLNAPYPLGETVITWTATDSSNNSASCPQTITVEDDEAPTLTVPADIVQGNDPGNCTAVVTFTVSATDNCDPTPEILCTFPSGYEFPIGTTVVECTATDDAGNSVTKSFNVTVTDAEKPTVSCSTTVTQLWPANHDLINVGLDVATSDNCGGPVTTTVAVYSNEDDVEDANHSPDAKAVAAGTLRLRADRRGSGSGRVYLIVVTGKDAAGNTRTACCTVVVPKAGSAASLNAVNAAATAARLVCETTGMPPAGYVLVGDGPVLGPKQ